MPVPQCRVNSSNACRKTIQRRSHCLGKLRTAISGGDVVTQLRSELRCLSKEERQELLQSAGLPVVIPPDHALALKADLSIPWSKLRVIRRQVKTRLISINSLECNVYRWLKTLNITLASEGKQRALAAEVTGDNLKAELGAFTFSHSNGGDEIREVPFAYVPNLIAKVADMVSAYERYLKNVLTMFTSQLKCIEHKQD